MHVALKKKELSCSYCSNKLGAVNHTNSNKGGLLKESKLFLEGDQVF